MGVKLWMRKLDQQNFNRSPPANGGYAGIRPTFKSCAPTRTCLQEESPQITAVLRCGEPRRRNATLALMYATARWYPNTKKAACKLQTAEPFGRVKYYIEEKTRWHPHRQQQRRRSGWRSRIPRCCGKKRRPPTCCH